MQKYKVENIAERLIENKDRNNLKYKNITSKKELMQSIDMKYPFIEYMSYMLKRY